MSLPPRATPPADALSALEAELLELQASLASSGPEALQQQALAVRASIGALAEWLAGTPPERLPPDAARRAQALAAVLAGTRDQLARVLALTQQQAASLLPPVDPVTYGPAGASKARIYQAPG